MLTALMAAADAVEDRTGLPPSIPRSRELASTRPDLAGLYAPSMWSESNNYGFENELDYLRSIKKDDSYTFTYPFEYIAKNHGNDNYDIGTADMVVRVQWSDTDAGYTMTYDIPEMHKIDPAEGNGDAESFYESNVYWRLINDLDGMGIGAALRAI